ncbi:MAG TPA: hypothetical protein PKE38_13580, partial [Ignavibacteriaceae bacterium]|nr:hypothetical protein [Ignavibacteriaceae bacterium]
MLQNFSDKKSLNQSKFILVKSLYYQNDLSRMLDEITTDKPSFDTDNYTLFSSIVYSLGIHQGYYFSEDKKINIINSFENLYSLLERRNYQASKFVIQNLISKTNIRNKQSLREFWLMTFDNIPQANILFFKNEIKNVIKLFSDDEEFELLSVKLSITEKNNQIAK